RHGGPDCPAAASGGLLFARVLGRCRAHRCHAPRRLDDHRRSRATRCGRLLLVRGARRRRDQERGLPHRTLRGRERDPSPPGRRGGRGGGDPQPAPGADRQGIRGPARGADAVGGASRRDRRAREESRRTASVSARDRVRAGLAQDGDGQDPALPAALGASALGDTHHFLGDIMTAFEAITGPTPWPARYTFSPAVRAGNLLFISGTTATDASGELVAPGDIVEQTRVILRKFQRLLEAAGGGKEHHGENTEDNTHTERYRPASPGAR